AVLLLAALGAVYWKRLTPPAVRPDALLPGGTLLLVEAVDLPRSALRWQKTELNQLWQEPEVQAFLEKPLATYPAFQQAGQYRKELVKLWPRQAFAAIVSMDGSTPKMLGGFSFAGEGKVAEPWLADARRKMKEAHPAGKAELILHGKIEIATYTDKDFVFAEATHADWHLAANDLALLKGALDRLDASKETRAAGLAEDADYRNSFAALPPDAELRIFARTGVFVDHLQAAVSAGDPTKATGLEALGKVRAVAAVSKIEGGQFHEAVFSLGDQGGKPEPLARPALELTDPETTGFYTIQTGALGLAGLPPELSGMVPFLGPLEAALKSEKATLADLPEIFGPEISLIIPPFRGPLSATLAVGLRDPQRAASLAAALADPKLGEEAWTKSDEEGLTVYTAPLGGGLLSIAPVLTVTDRYWLLGRSPASLAPLVQRDVSTPQLDHTAAWREVTGAVVAPTQSFGYFNLGSLFESYYATLRPLIALGLVGSDEVGRYVDAGKLPNAAVVSRHLGGMAFSQATVPSGSLWEARGNISAGEALLVGAAAWLWSGAEMPELPGLPGAQPPAPGPER
ncbi:MAG TPA: hypothetical protein VGO11_01630, partial [Chthoniobacteraceae bacterium]|nr:hypothetical protein [Chthoniobacteraceae bacterium]